MLLSAALGPLVCRDHAMFHEISYGVDTISRKWQGYSVGIDAVEAPLNKLINADLLRLDWKLSRKIGDSVIKLNNPSPECAVVCSAKCGDHIGSSIV